MIWSCGLETGLELEVWWLSYNTAYESHKDRATQHFISIVLLLCSTLGSTNSFVTGVKWVLSEMVMSKGKTGRRGWLMRIHRVNEIRPSQGWWETTAFTADAHPSDKRCHGEKNIIRFSTRFSSDSQGLAGLAILWTLSRQQITWSSHQALRLTQHLTPAGFRLQLNEDIRTFLLVVLCKLGERDLFQIAKHSWQNIVPSQDHCKCTGEGWRRNEERLFSESLHSDFILSQCVKLAGGETCPVWRG